MTDLQKKLLHEVVIREERLMRGEPVSGQLRFVTPLGDSMDVTLLVEYGGYRGEVSDEWEITATLVYVPIDRFGRRVEDDHGPYTDTINVWDLLTAEQHERIKRLCAEDADDPFRK